MCVCTPPPLYKELTGGRTDLSISQGVQLDLFMTHRYAGQAPNSTQNWLQYSPLSPFHRTMGKDTVGENYLSKLSYDMKLYIGDVIKISEECISLFCEGNVMFYRKLHVKYIIFNLECNNTMSDIILLVNSL